MDLGHSPYKLDLLEIWGHFANKKDCYHLNVWGNNCKDSGQAKIVFTREGKGNERGHVSHENQREASRVEKGD